MHCAKSIKRSLQNRFAACHRANVFMIGHCLAALCGDLGNDLLCKARLTLLCGSRKVVNDDAGTFPCQQQRVGAAQTCASTGDYYNLSIEQTHSNSPVI